MSTEGRFACGRLELLGLIEETRQGAGAADRAADVALHRLKRYLKRHPAPEWVWQQVYLHPYPKELTLRNHVWVW
jgi:uncharacterized protein YbgA (DUF1722 family)